MPSVGSSRRSSFGSRQQHAGDGELLLLAARQHAPLAAEQRLQLREQREDLVEPSGPAPAAPPPEQAHAQVLRHGQVREDLAPLGHVADPAGGALLGPAPREVGPVEGDAAAARGRSPIMRLEQRGLAHAVPAHEADHAARRHRRARRPTAPGSRRRRRRAPGSQAWSRALLHPGSGPGTPRITRSSCCTWSTEPSQSTRPSWSTVTVRAMRRTNSMSCSMTRTARSCATVCKQPAGALGLLVGHPRHRLVHQQQLGVLHEHHADLEPLLLAVGEAAGPLAPPPPARPDGLERGSSTAAPRSRSSRARSVASTPLLARASDSSRFSRTVRLAKIDGRLELAPDAEARRSRSPAGPTRSVLFPKITRPAEGCTLPEITSSRVVLPGAVRADHHAQLPVVHEEVQGVRAP